MQNYKQNDISGESWIRANRVVVDNPLNGSPSIMFVEERVLNIGEDSITVPVSDVRSNIHALNKDTQFPLLHPETGIEVGTATYEQVYLFLHSLYYHLATTRDAANAPPEV